METHPYVTQFKRGQCLLQCPGRFLGITGWDPSVWKSNRLHVDSFWLSFIKLGWILQIPLKWWVIFLQSWTSTGYFSNSTSSSVTNCRFSPITGLLHYIWYFFVTMITFWMTLLMNKAMDTIMNGGWVHLLAKTLPFLVSYSSFGSSSILRILCLLAPCDASKQDLHQQVS